MLMEKTVYAVQCSQCWCIIADELTEEEAHRIVNEGRGCMLIDEDVFCYKCGADEAQARRKEGTAMDKIVDSVEALRFALTATKDDPNIRAFEVPRNVAEDVLSELDRLREFSDVLSWLLSSLDHMMVNGKPAVYSIGVNAARAKALKIIARATGREGT